MNERHLKALEQELTLRRLSPATQLNYGRPIQQLSAYHKRPFESLGIQHVRAFLLHVLQRGSSSPAKHKMYVAALKFFFRHVLPRPDLAEAIPWPKVPKTLPVVLSRAEIQEVLRAITVLKYRVLAAVAYGTGLRVSECRHLQVGDIDASRMTLHVRLGKGAKDRYVPLPSVLLKALRAYWRIERPAKPWLFPNDTGTGPIGTRGIQRALQLAGEAAGLDKRCSPHVLRYSYATHQLEAGVDLATLQSILGHSDLSCTFRYLLISNRRKAAVGSPIDTLWSTGLPGTVG